MNKQLLLTGLIQYLMHTYHWDKVERDFGSPCLEA